MTRPPSHYETLDLAPAATQAEIKHAYRRLVKKFHPDANPNAPSHEKIAEINAAYEVLGDPQRRQSYDRQMRQRGDSAVRREATSRTKAAQDRYRQRTQGQSDDEHLKRWILRVYQPVNRHLNQVIKPLPHQVNELAADPFDDDLLEGFQSYLEECRDHLQRAQTLFGSMPNPASVAGVAAHLYHCLNQLGDGVDELERFVMCYNEHYLHTGQELFRIAKGLRREAQTAMRTSDR
ncbi:MAG: DnaJ domain-containing protein [Kaiparowitsia implicata GSE-PSE-MK54-09C]|jgi:molecular chaperone DnaJ|nr:DnaJ domain-containing protein [Kaiparowitsia implicata GSE-PSE-MK54-09C]